MLTHTYQILHFKCNSHSACTWSTSCIYVLYWFRRVVIQSSPNPLKFSFLQRPHFKICNGRLAWTTPCVVSSNQSFESYTQFLHGFCSFIWRQPMAMCQFVSLCGSCAFTVSILWFQTLTTSAVMDHALNEKQHIWIVLYNLSIRK